MVRFKITLAIAFMVISFSGFSQRNYTQEADQSFDNFQYYLAVDKYKTAYDKVKNNKTEKNRILFRIGECYRKVNDYKKAEAQFKRLVKYKYQSIEPLVLLYYADALRSNGNFQEALVYYKQYNEVRPEDVFGKNGVLACELGPFLMDNPERYEITNEKKLNSSRDDWAPAFSDSKFQTLIFSSNRNGVTGGGTDSWTGESFTDLFVAKRNKKNEWSDPVLIDDQGIVNTRANEGPGMFDKQNNTLYFTRCGNDKKKVSGCGIYFCEKLGNTWKDPVFIPLAPDGYDVVHPAISSDELTLYFVSNMPGGQGDMDIWYVKRQSKSKEFGKPVNLGSVVNTPGKEEFPTLWNDSVLFFSSNTLPGIGGYDIFKTSVNSNGFSSPQNLGYPVNSQADDFNLILQPDGAHGYFSSNRTGGKGGDDIYSFYLPPLEFSLKGKITDEVTHVALPDIEIVISDRKGNHYETKSDNNGCYSINKTRLFPDETYDLVFKSKNHYSQKEKISTKGVTKNKDFVMDIKLKPIENKLIVLPEILYDFARWDIRKPYQDSLLGLVKTMKENPGLVIELSSHTDSRNDDAYNDDLSQKRAESAVSILISQGIEPDRLIAKGYGKRMPAQLEKEIISDGYTFKKGTVLTDEFIESLPTKEIREFAHQLNRRTAFKVIRTDYKPNLVIADKSSAINQPTEKYTVQLGTGKPNPKLEKLVPDLKSCKGKDGIIRLISGSFNSRDEAGNYLKKLMKEGVKEGFVAPIDHNRIDCY